MASFSMNLAAGTVDTGPDNISTGTNVPGAGDIELRINAANIQNRQEAIRLASAFLRRLEDDRYNDLTTV